MKELIQLATKDDIKYEQEFGAIPNEQLDRIAYILGKRATDQKFNDKIQKDAKRIKRIKWKSIQFSMWKIIKPSARPRATRRSGYISMYVPHAHENGTWFEKFAAENNLPFIDTPCIFNLTVYEKTPSSFSVKNKVLAELGFIRPWKRTGDFDNYAKAVADAIQHGMLKDDCLIIESSISLKYSVKPHSDVEIKYMEKFPEY